MNLKPIIITTIVVLLMCGTASAWLTGYDHRMAITVNNGGASSLSHYQFNFTNDTNVLVAAGNMQSSGADCQITDAADNLLPFWNETPFNAVSTRIWVNATTLAVGDNTFYMYYSNPSAISVANGATTFESFDDFSRSNTYGSIITVANAVLDATHGTFSDGTDYWNAAPAYTKPFAADTWYAFTGYPNYFNATQINTIYQKIIDARDENGHFPIALNADGTAYAFYSGCDNIHAHTTGDPIWFLPMMMRLYYNKSSNTTKFSANLALIKTEMANVPRNSTTKLVDAGAPSTAWTSWGFQDGIQKTGDDLMGSLLYYKASVDLSFLYTTIGDTTNATFFTDEANDIADNISVLWNASEGMFHAATGQNDQIDILGSSYAVYVNITNQTQTTAISNYLVNNYATIVSNGFIRESPQNWTYTWGGNMCGREAGNYDDGYWSVGHEWVATAIQKTNEAQAVQFIADFSNNADMSMEYYGATLNGATNNLPSPMGALKFASDNENLFHRQYTTNGGTIGFSNNKMIITGVSFGHAIVAPIPQSPPSSYIVEAKATCAFIGGSDQYHTTGLLGFQSSVASSDTGYETHFGMIDFVNRTGVEKFGVAHIANNSISFTEGNYYLIKGTFVSGGVKATFERTTSATTTDTSYTSGYYGLGTYDANSTVDWFFVRQYASPEPAATLGAEETNGDSTNTIVLGANKYGMLRKSVTSAQSFSTIAGEFSHDICFTWWDSTNDRWESYYSGDSYNSAKSVPEHDSYFVLMDGTGETVSCSVAAAENVDIPIGWSSTYLRESTSKTLSAIKTDMGSNCADVYAWDHTASGTGAWTNTGTFSVLPNQGILVDASSGFTWDGSVS